MAPKTQIPDPVRLLLVEDNGDDAELLFIELSAAGMAFELRRVETAAQLRSAIEDCIPHLVICDGNLPGFSGIDALLLVRGLAPTIPFVFLSGDDDDRIVAAALRHGAAAYVPKQQLRNMPATIVGLLAPA